MRDKRSTPSIRYGLFARLSDWWCGRRDGRKGIPSVPEGARPGTPEAELSTPRMMFLGQLGVGRIEREWIAFQLEVLDLEAALREATSRQADAEVARLEEQIRIGLRVTQRRAAMIEAYVRRRCAAYLTQLVRRHPDGARLNHLMRPRWPDQIDWARTSLGPELPSGVARAGMLGVRGS
ncbi:hypothetical protein [Phytohabitans houttuyneae]|uniref:Uncharacterized protein n=1 Tax=Phytohabitans houttuyneae TaxID=1076126 RepID=A0A6V8KRZ3_9ACTN|nr:hypothetical protein [Phytohabitans houttuyneae]GFJ85059.1 hypothetical protein Phou_092390 [Phytohabitans houttuyneae]